MNYVKVILKIVYYCTIGGLVFLLKNLGSVANITDNVANGQGGCTAIFLFLGVWLWAAANVLVLLALFALFVMIMGGPDAFMMHINAAK